MTTAFHVKPVYTIPEFCRDFAIGRTVVYEEIQAGRLRAFKLRAGTRIAGEDAMAWRELYRGKKAA